MLMTTRYGGPRRKLSPDAEESCGGSRRTLRSISAAMRAAQAAFPNKTALELALRSGASPRSAETWLAGKGAPSAEALAELLRSDIGLTILEAIMTGAEPPWWEALRRQIAISRLRRAQVEHQRALEALEREAAP